MVFQNCFYLNFGVFCSETKELSLSHKLWFSNPYIFATQFLVPYIFEIKYTVRSNNLSLKYQSLTPSGSEDTGILVCDKNSIPFIKKQAVLLKKNFLLYTASFLTYSPRLKYQYNEDDVRLNIYFYFYQELSKQNKKSYQQFTFVYL